MIGNGANQPAGNGREKDTINLSQDSGDDLEQMITVSGEGSSVSSGSGQNSRVEMQSKIGSKLGKYELTQLLGSGGMGAVYKAYDSMLERIVAIKILPPGLSSNPLALQRFLVEARAVGKLNHPHAVTIYEIAKQDETNFIVMEFVSGGCIADRLKEQGALSVFEATQIISDACKGLAAAHAAGIIHRDIKPANLLRSSDGAVKIADFGLAKNAVRSEQHLTRAGEVVGTPYFMSPEQCESKPVDNRSDLYSLGATYYSLLTNNNPYGSISSTVNVMYAHCHADIPDPQKDNPQVPDACAAIITRAMAKKPEERYQSAEEMLKDIDAVTSAMSGAMQINLPSDSRMAALQVPVVGAVHAKATRFFPLFAAYAMVSVLTVAVAMMLIFDFTNRSGADKKTTNSSDANKNPVVALSGKPIQVGILHSLSGTLSDSESAVVDATLLAIDELNRSGGVLGRRVKAIVRDGRSDSSQFAIEAKRLLEEDDVCVVFGCWTSASRKTVVPIFESHNHLLVYPVQFEGIEESANVIYLGASPNQQIIPAVKWAYAFLNKRRFFLVGSDYIFPRTANEIIKDTLDELGAELVGEEYIQLGSSQTKEIVAKIMEAKPDIILNTINGSSNIAFFRELRAAGIKPENVSTISFSIGEEELRQLEVSKMVGDYAAWNYFQSIDSAENQHFVEQFKAKYGPQRVITDPMEAAYIGVFLWAKAVTEINSVDVIKVRQAMLNQSILAPEGEVRIDPENQHAYKTLRIGQIRADGQFDIIWKAATPRKPEPFPGSRTPEQWNAFLQELYTNWGNQWEAPAVDD